MKADGLDSEAGLEPDTSRCLAIFNHANHFLITNPIDPTTGRSYLDEPTPDLKPNSQIELSKLIIKFANTECLGREAAKSLSSLGNDLVENEILARFEINPGG